MKQRSLQTIDLTNHI